MKRMHRLARTQQIDQPLDNVFGFFSDAANLPALTPAFLRFRIRTPGPIEMKTGVQIDYTISLFGIPLRWRTRITDWQPGVRFVDEQEAGPPRRDHALAAPPFDKLTAGPAGRARWRPVGRRR